MQPHPPSSYSSSLDIKLRETTATKMEGFLFGAVASYAIKKVMKIAAVVIGLFVAGLAYLSYRGWVDVKWIAIENASRSTLTNASEQVVNALNNTATQFASHPSAVAASGLPIAAMFGFVPGLMMGFKKG
jgi:uncharacterized membrane protein (Fun14 family)